MSGMLQLCDSEQELVCLSSHRSYRIQLGNTDLNLISNICIGNHRALSRAANSRIILDSTFK